MASQIIIRLLKQITAIDMDKAVSSKVEQTVFKAVFVGDEQTGKTCLAKRIVEDTCQQLQLPTLGANRLEKIYPELKLKLEIYDTSGQETYRAIVPLYTKFADWIVYVFDLTKPETLERFQTYWIGYLHKNAPGNTMIAICGCKGDLKHQINSQILKKYQKKYPYFETSALKGTNTEGIFARMLEQWKKKKYILGLRGQIVELQRQKQKLSVRMNQIGRLIKVASKKQLQYLQQMIKNSNQKEPSYHNVAEQYKTKLKDFHQLEEKPSQKWIFGSLDKLSNNPETLIELYEADTLKMRQNFGAGGRIGEIAGKFKERCRILQGICGQIEGLTLKNLTHIISRVSEAYEKYKQEYWSQETQSFAINKQDQVSIGVSSFLDGLNFSQILEE